MKIALAQINFHTGNLQYNLNRMLEMLSEARALGADLVVFAELSVCGYPPRDLLESDAFVTNCLEVVNQLARHCQGIAAIVGSPSFNPRPGGKRLHNSAYLLFDGRVQDVAHKGLLPTYDVFNENRYFEGATDFHVMKFKGRRIAMTICEDIWNVDGQGLYATIPCDELIKEEPSLIINISASPYAWNHLPRRMEVLSMNARKYRLPLFSVNLVGGQTGLLFDGVSAAINPRGEVAGTLPRFGEGISVFDLDQVSRENGRSLPAEAGGHEKSASILAALEMGVADYFSKTGMKKAIIGLSGGIDSALTLVIAARALGRENLWAVLLPGPFSSEHSVSDAVALAENLGVRYDIISVNDAVQSLENSLAPFFVNTLPGVAEENLQARARANILMGLSNKFGHMLLNTSNKSEAAVGYTTLYGDMCGGLSVLGDVYKTWVYELAHYINREQEIIPGSTIQKPPSAELSPGQKDSDSLPEYEVLDAILSLYIDRQMDRKQILDAGIDPELVNKVLRMVQTSEYKRKQSPPILRVTGKCLDIGREMPLDAHYPW